MKLLHHFAHSLSIHLRRVKCWEEILTMIITILIGLLRMTAVRVYYKCCMGSVQPPQQYLPSIQFFCIIFQVCQAARINYGELIKFLKRECKCNSKLCPNWECTCMADDENGKLGDCSCPSCDCLSYTSCQVHIFQQLLSSFIDVCHPSSLWLFLSNIDGAGVSDTSCFWF